MSNEITLAGYSGSQVDLYENALLTQDQDEREPFSWTTVTADIDLTDNGLIVTNNSTSKHLHIIRAFVFIDVTTAIEFYMPVFATWTGTAVTGIPLNRAGINIAPATALSDANVAQANVILRIATNELTTGQHGQWVEFGDNLALGYHDSLAFDIVAESTAFYSAFIGYFHNN